MHNINFKNILIGIGTFVILASATGVGLYSKAYLDNQEIQNNLLVKNQRQTSNLNFNPLNSLINRSIKECLSAEEYQEDVNFNGLEKPFSFFVEQGSILQKSEFLTKDGYVYRWSSAGNKGIQVSNPKGITEKTIFINHDAEIQSVAVDEKGNMYVLFSDTKVAKFVPKWLCGEITIRLITKDLGAASKNSTEIFNFGKNFAKTKDQDFYEATPYYSNFTLSESNNTSLKSVTFKLSKPGNYKVFQNLDPLYSTKVTCTDPTKNTTINKDQDGAEIVIDPTDNGAENVICDFINTENKE